MNRGGLLVLALLVSGAPAATAGGTDPRLDAFRAACIPDRQSFEASWLRAKQEGWVAVEADDHDELAGLLDVSAGHRHNPDVVINTLRKEIEGRPIYLVLLYNGATVSCHLYDFDGETAIDPQLLADWLGKPPTQTDGAPGEGGMQVWQGIDSLPGSDVYNGFIPADSPIEPHAGFSGVALRINSVGR